jgi:hypothetical protein
MPITQEVPPHTTRKAYLDRLVNREGFAPLAWDTVWCMWCCYPAYTSRDDAPYGIACTAPRDEVRAAYVPGFRTYWRVVGPGGGPPALSKSLEEAAREAKRLNQEHRNPAPLVSAPVSGFPCRVRWMEGVSFVYEGTAMGLTAKGGVVVVADEGGLWGVVPADTVYSPILVPGGAPEWHANVKTLHSRHNAT